MTRLVQLYVFHGKYTFTRTVRKQKVSVKKPVLHALHYMLSSHRSRFHHNVEDHFKQLYELLEKNPAWTVFLDDLGVGTPPLAFLIAVEVGLRSYALSSKSRHTMRIDKINSPEVWGFRVKDWRKIESFITAVRKFRKRVRIHFRSLPNPNTYICI